MKKGSTLRKIVEKIATIMDYLACVLICILCLWVTVDVIGRTLFHTPIPGTAELAANSIVAILFFEIALVEVRGKNLRSDIFLRKFGPVCQGIIETISTLFGLVIFAGGSYFCINGMLLSWRIQEYDGEGALQIPTYLFKTVVAVGCVLMVIVLLFSLYDAIMMIVHGKTGQEHLSEGGNQE